MVVLLMELVSAAMWGVPRGLQGLFFFFRGENVLIIWVFPKIMGYHPQIINFKRVFHYCHHPFWGTPIFGNSHIGIQFKFYVWLQDVLQMANKITVSLESGDPVGKLHSTWNLSGLKKILPVGWHLFRCYAGGCQPVPALQCNWERFILIG